MVLEYAQLLCTAHHVLDGEKTVTVNKKGEELQPKYKHTNPQLYKTTHVNHPCAVWVRTNSANYAWLFDLFQGVCDEYTYRYAKTHKTDMKLRLLLSVPPENIKSSKCMTPFALCVGSEDMPSQDVDAQDVEANAVAAYRRYYVREKAGIAKWNKTREAPEWWRLASTSNKKKKLERGEKVKLEGGGEDEDGEAYLEAPMREERRTRYPKRERKTVKKQ